MPLSTEISSNSTYRRALTISDSSIEKLSWEPQSIDLEQETHTFSISSQVKQIRIKYTTSSVYGLYYGDGIVTINGVQFILNTSCLLNVDLFANGYCSIEFPEIPVQNYIIDSSSNVSETLNSRVGAIDITVIGSKQHADAFEITLIK